MNIFNSYFDLIYSLINNTIITILLIILLNNLLTLPLDLFLNTRISILIKDLNSYIEQYYKLDSEEEKNQYKFKISKVYKKHKSILLFSGMSFIISLLIFIISFHAIQNSTMINPKIIFGLDLSRLNSFYIFPIIITVLFFFINRYIINLIELKSKDKENVQQRIITISFIILIFGFAMKNTVAGNTFIIINEIIALSKVYLKKAKKSNNLLNNGKA